jgi:hypothetical protein
MMVSIIFTYIHCSIATLACWHRRHPNDVLPLQCTKQDGETIEVLKFTGIGCTFYCVAKDISSFRKWGTIALAI